MLLAACSDAILEPAESTQRLPPMSAEPATPEVPGTDDPATPNSAMVPASGDLDGKDVRTRSQDAVGDGVVPQGYTTITAEITSVDGDVCSVCLWLADSPDERRNGLKGMTDLGGPVGMAFLWDAPLEGNFVMIGTPTPLSIAWFNPDRSFLAQTDMEPCLGEDSTRCERYPAGGPYDLAIEMFQGELDKIGIGPGSRIELLAGTESAMCALAR
jgi:uncharacterized membrane protein (UPF0127 family)